MEWRDDAVVLSARRHGESALIVHVLTANHGRHAGLVPGGGGRRRRARYEPGTELRCHWRARLSEHLGRLSGETVRARSARLFDDAGRLAALAAACALCDAVLPERAPHRGLFRALIAFLDTLETEAEREIWSAAYVRWEVGVLAEIGFSLDLSRCAATGTRDDLRWVSPRTGRAVSRAGGAGYADRLLALPGFLIGDGAPTPEAVGAGLRLTGHFLRRHDLAGAGILPAARERLLHHLATVEARA